MSILGTESPYSSLEDLYSYLWNTEVPEKHHFEKYLFKDLPWTLLINKVDNEMILPITVIATRPLWE